jgi:hypothetical protein
VEEFLFIQEKSMPSLVPRDGRMGPGVPSSNEF